jgi:VWFA-related protein
VIEGLMKALVPAAPASLLLAACMSAAQQGAPEGAARQPQLTPRTAQERETTYRRHHRVIVNVDVRDGSGAAVKGLRPADFTVLAGGAPQKIVRLAAADQGSAANSAHLLVVIDAMDDTADELSDYGVDLDRFLRSGPGPVPLSLLVLTHTGLQKVPWSADVSVMMAAYARAVKQARRMNCTVQRGAEDLSSKLYQLAESPDFVAVGRHNEALAECMSQRFRIAVDSLKKLAAEERRTAGRAIVVWLGDGWPVPTEKGMERLDAGERQRFFQQVVELSDTLRDSRLTLNAIWRPGPDRVFDLRLAEWDRAFKGAPSRAELSRQSVSVAAMAHLSGGQVFANTEDVAGALRQCSADAGAFYQLFFDPEPAEKAIEFRTIEVKVARPDVTVRSPTAYYAHP